MACGDVPSTNKWVFGDNPSVSTAWLSGATTASRNLRYGYLNFPPHVSAIGHPSSNMLLRRVLKSPIMDQASCFGLHRPLPWVIRNTVLMLFTYEIVPLLIIYLQPRLNRSARELRHASRRNCFPPPLVMQIHSCNHISWILVYLKIHVHFGYVLNILIQVENHAKGLKKKFSLLGYEIIPMTINMAFGGSPLPSPISSRTPYIISAWSADTTRFRCYGISGH